MRKIRRGVTRYWLVVLVVFAFSVGHAQEKKTTTDEALLLGDIPSVFGASRFDQTVTEAPASVTVITADEIAAYGWRTLSDLLRTVRGFYVTNDRAYSYVGTRGFSRPGDYNTRVLLLLDGVRLNENIFDGGYVGLEGLVDLAAVERVEVIRGPASSLYGTNAFFGIVNVVTVRGRARSGMQVGGELGSFGTREGLISAGGRDRHGVEYYATASRRRVGGQDLYFQEFDTPATNHGLAVGRDDEHRDRFFGKVEWGSLALEGTINQRTKVVPTASYGTRFDSGRLAFRDFSRNLVLRYQNATSEVGGISASAAVYRYDYDGTYPYDSSTTLDWAHGRWGVVDMQYTRRLGQHRLVVGGAYTRNWRQEQGLLDDVGAAPTFVDNTTSDMRALYALGEVRLSSRLLFNGGLRYDHASSFGSDWNPRAGLIYQLGTGSAVKLLYGSAFRAPNNFERLYGDDRTQKPNTALAPEHIRTYELLVEKLLNRHVKWSISAYQYQARQLIDLALDPVDSLLQFNNLGRANGRGVESEVELDFGTATARMSYALQVATDPDGATLSNSPRHLGAFNISTPVARDHARVALQVRGMSSRLTPQGDAVSGNIVADAVLTTRRRSRGPEITAGIYNVTNQRYSDPVGEEHLQRAIQQDGRTMRLTVVYGF